MKKVSIIVPMYGVEKYIKDCLESVAAQTFKDIECIVIDDYSPDHSYDIAREFIDDYKGEIEFKIVRHQVNKGLSGARNTGIESSTGEYLFFLDSDDLITENAIDVLYSNKRDADLTMGNNLIFSDYTGEIIRQPKTTSKDYYYFDSLYDYMTNPDIVVLNNYGLAWNKLFKKSFIDEHKLRFDEGIYFEDDVWSYKVYSHGPKIVVISEATYKYRSRENGIMNKYNDNHLLSSIKSPHIAIQYAKEENVSEKWYVDQRIEEFILSTLYTCLDRTNDTSLFYRVYNHFLQIHKPSFSFFHDNRISKATKIKALHYFIPVLGKYFLKSILIMQQNKMHKLYPSRAILPKVELSKSFWEKLNAVICCKTTNR